MMGLVVSPAGQADGEQVVLTMRPHVKTMVRPAAVLVLIAAVTVAVLVVLPASLGSLGMIRLVIAVVALVAAVVWFGVPVLRWRATSYELTTRRLRMRMGIISRTGRDFPLVRISDVSFSQGPLDRLFGCGRLIVESAGENGRLVLTETPAIQRVQSVLFDLVSRETERAGWADASGY